MQLTNDQPRRTVLAGILDRLKLAPSRVRALRALAPYIWPHDRPDLHILRETRE